MIICWQNEITTEKKNKCEEKWGRDKERPSQSISPKKNNFFLEREEEKWIRIHFMLKNTDAAQNIVPKGSKRLNEQEYRIKVANYKIHH